MRSRTFFIIALFFFYVLGYSQSAPFEAVVGSTKVPSGSTFEVKFVLHDLEGKDFTPPDFAPFRVLSGPMSSYRSSFVNGRGSKTTTISYTLQARDQGKFEIDVATIKVGAKVLRSNPIIITVTAAKAPTTIAEVDSETQIFLRAEIDSSALYVGQQVMLLYRIYTQVNIDNYNIIAESPYPSCYAQALDAYKEPVVSTTINGVDYSSKVLRKVAVYPQRSGLIEIEPMVIQIGIQRRKRSSFGGFFPSYSYDRKNLTSNALVLEVNSLFDRAPQDFTGAVGNFRVQHEISKKRASTDDALVLAVNIVGNGDVKTIHAPELVAPDGAVIFDPKTTHERMVNASDSVRGEKRFEYLVTFDQAGDYNLTSAFTYFNPKTNSFISTADTFLVDITPGKNPRYSDDQLALAEEGSGELAEIWMEGKVGRKRPTLMSTPYYWGAFSLPVLAFLLLSWRDRHQEEEVEEEVDHTRLAQERLQRAEKLLEGNEQGAFYEEIAFSIKKYLGWRLGLDAADFNRRAVKELLIKKKVPEHLVLQTDSLLQTCDVALYGGGLDQAGMRKTYSGAMQLIADFEQILHE